MMAMFCDEPSPTKDAQADADAQTSSKAAPRAADFNDIIEMFSQPQIEAITVGIIRIPAAEPRPGRNLYEGPWPVNDRLVINLNV
jgi:hypothetical protein